MLLYGTAELARAAGIKPKTLAGYLARGQCPEPYARLECGPVWRAEDVQAWIESRDSRLEALAEVSDAVWTEEVLARSPFVWDNYAKGEQARRNVHNHYVQKRLDRTGVAVSRGKGFVPSVKSEAFAVAERELRVTEEYVGADSADIVRRGEWARELLNLRQANRSGHDDGIPF